MSMHKLRNNQDERCPTCDAAPLIACTMAESVKRDQDMRNPALDDREWLEFQLLAVFHNLKKVQPNHYLVRVIEAALTPNYPGEELPSLLRKQADLLRKQADLLRKQAD